MVWAVDPQIDALCALATGTPQSFLLLKEIRMAGDVPQRILTPSGTAEVEIEKLRAECDRLRKDRDSLAKELEDLTKKEEIHSSAQLKLLAVSPPDTFITHFDIDT
jgi:hypothetical protein